MVSSSDLLPGVLALTVPVSKDNNWVTGKLTCRSRKPANDALVYF